MKISYTVPSLNRTIVTGGHKYDNDFIDVIDKKTEHHIEKLSLNISKWHNNLLIAPLLYLIKALKNSGDTDIYLFNSVIFMRFMLLPFFLKYVRQKKVFAFHHHFTYRQLKGVKRFIYKQFEWAFLNRMDKIIVPSPYVYQELLKVYPKEKLLFHQIPFHSEQKYIPNPQKGNLVFAGTIEARKGLVYLINVLALLKKRGREYSLTIVGKVVEQSYYENLLRIINENNLNVTFTGFVTQEEKDKMIAKSDIFVFPSLLEGYGMALVEAQVYGLPIVSFDNSAMPYNVKNEINGYTVKTGDIEEFANAIEKIVENRDLRQKFSKGALENLKNQNTFDEFEQKIKLEFNNIESILK